MNKKITINYIFNLSYQLLIVFFPLITTPYVSRVLGPEGVGTYSYTVSVTAYFILFGCIGLNLYGQREIAFNQENTYNRSKIFFEILILKIMTMGVSIIIFLITIQQIGKYKLLFYIQIMDLIANMIDITYFYQGIEEFKRIVIRNVIVKIVGIFLIFTLVKEASDLPIYTLIYSATLLVSNIILWVPIKRYICKVYFKQLCIKKHFKYTLILFFPQVAISIYTILDRLMIGLITDNNSQVGYYEQAQKIVKLILTIVTSLSTIMLPRIANLFANNKNDQVIRYTERSLEYTFLLAFPMMFGIMGISDNLVPWFLGEEFMPSSNIIKIISPIILFIGTSNIIGIQYLLPTKKQSIYTSSTLIGAGINFCLNLAMIPMLSSFGAAIATVCAELSVDVFQIFFVRKEINIYSICKRTKNYVISSFSMFLIIKSLGVFLEASILSTISLVVMGICVYILLLLLLKDELAIETKDIILRRVHRHK